MGDTSIRWALPDDLPFVVDLSRELHSESPWYSQYPFDESHVKQQYLNRINGDRRFSFLAFYDGKVVGFLFGYFSVHLTAPLLSAVEEVLYVLPVYRGMRIGARLIKEMDMWAHSHRALFLKIGNSSGITPERTALFYQRSGFTPFTTIYIKELEK